VELNRRKILVVEDNPTIRLLIRLALEHGYEVFEATDGERALVMVRAHKPDLVILDVMMPGALNGFEVLEQIKSDPELKHILCAMISARGQAEDLETGRSKGADQYFVKPFSPLQLFEWIQKNVPPAE
jgi:CheY-like chemotaxis protein